jgi:hypothetical protein
MTAAAPVMDCPEQPTLPFDHVPWGPSAPTPIETMATLATSPGPDVIVDGRYRILRRFGREARRPCSTGTTSGCAARSPSRSSIPRR